MKKPVSVADKLRGIENRVPFVHDFSDAVALATSIDPADLDATDRRIIERILQQLLEVLTELPRERRELHRIDDALQALVPDFAASLEQVTEHCRHCDELFQPRRSDARYCSARCRVAAKRIRDRSELAVTANG